MIAFISWLDLGQAGARRFKPPTSRRQDTHRFQTLDDMPQAILKNARVLTVVVSADDALQCVLANHNILRLSTKCYAMRLV